MAVSSRVILALSLAVLLCLPVLGAEQFVGKVVGISDGDTLSVLREGKAVKVRLYGIDTPERRQAFSTAADKSSADAPFSPPRAAADRVPCAREALLGARRRGCSKPPWSRPSGLKSIRSPVLRDANGRQSGEIVLGGVARATREAVHTDGDKGNA